MGKMDSVKLIVREITVEPIMFLYMFTCFLYVPVFQSLIFDKVCLSRHTSQFCSQLRNNSDSPSYHSVNSETSEWILYTNIALTVPSAVFVLLFYGALGDKIGRKLPVILPCFGALFTYLSALINSHFMHSSLYFLLIGPLLNGLCGGFVACLMAVYSYVGHVSSLKSKMARISTLEASIFIAGTVGIFISGIILEGIGYDNTFLTLIVVVCMAIIYAFVCLKNVRGNELTTEGKDNCGWFIVKNIKESFQCVRKRRAHRVLASLVLQVLCLNILMFVTSGDIDINFLYVREKLGFDRVLYGYYKGLDSFLRGITLIVIPRLVKHFFSVNDFLLVLVGILSYAASFVTLSLAASKWVVFLGSVLGMLKGFPSAGLRTQMSSMVLQNEQGRLFGMIAASESITTLLASLVFNTVYPWSYDILPGLCYLLGAGLLVVNFILVIYIMRTYPKETAQLSDSPAASYQNLSPTNSADHDSDSNSNNNTHIQT